MKERQFIRYLVLILGILALGVTLGYQQVTPNRVPPSIQEELITLEDWPDPQESFNLTLSHVYYLAQEPHPSGSLEIEEVRQYLQSQFVLLGAEYEVQAFEKNLHEFIEERVAAAEEEIKKHPEDKELYERYLDYRGVASSEELFRRQYLCENRDKLDFKNFLVKVEGDGTGGGVLFVSHYDSTSGGPGAADDAISVAIMLEALRLTLGQTQRKNDLYFLFTDGEEIDMIGANHFVEYAPELKDKIDVVFNLEARGTSGPLIMFETSPGNKNLVLALIESVEHVVPVSVATTAYRYMSNNTDFSMFLKAGYSGLNFAMVGNPDHYHAMADNFANLNRDSAYMYFRTAVDLASFFSAADLSAYHSDEDAVFFPFFKGKTVIISEKGMTILAYIVIAVSLIWLVFRGVRKDFRWSILLLSWVALLATLACAALLGFLSSKFYEKISESEPWILRWDALNMISFLLCGVLVLTLVLGVWKTLRRVGMALAKQALYAYLLLMIMLSLTCAIILPGVSYLFVIPLALLLIYLILDVLGSAVPWIRILAIVFNVCMGVIVLLLYTPLVYLLYQALLSAFLPIAGILIALAVFFIAVACMLDESRLAVKTSRELVQKTTIK